MLASKQTHPAGLKRYSTTNKRLHFSRPVRPVFPSVLIQPKSNCSCGGVCPRCRGGGSNRSKLKIGAPDNNYEREADRVTDQVMHPKGTSFGARMPATAEEDEQAVDNLQAKTVPGRPAGLHYGNHNRIQSLRGGGQPLSPSTRSFFEPRFGRDLSDVRIHDNHQAADTAKSIGALAFTTGNDIVFGAGQFAPETISGKRLLAHELTHVLQQNDRETFSTLQMKPDPTVSQRLGMKVVTYEDNKIEATVNRGWTEESGIASTIIGMSVVTGLSEETLIRELVESGAYRDEEHVRGGFIEGTRVIVKDGAIEEISVRGKVYKAGGVMQPDFEFFLKEGTQLFSKADFGLCSGEAKGRDPADGYDSRYWVEEGARGSIRARIQAWDAMDKLVQNIGKDVPKAGGGLTKWSFDCYEATLILRLYAIWRTTNRSEFNSVYHPLRFGFHAGTQTGLAEAFHSDGPGEPAYQIEGENIGGLIFDPTIITLSKSITDIALEAPIGSLIAFGSKDIQEKCRANSNLGICAFQFENTIKVGSDQFFAHPFGTVSSGEIFRRMAEAAGATPSMDYYRNNIYISTVRYPK